MREKTYLEQILRDFDIRYPDRLSGAEECFVKQYLLDLLGCGLAGKVMWSECPMPDCNMSMWGEKKERVKLWGNRLESGTLESAALINGCQSAYLELDDATAIGASVHPGASVIPAALAAAECYHKSGPEFMKAVLAGYEVCNRFGLMATEQIQKLGLYGPSFVGAGGAVIAAGKIMGLEEERLLWAFSNALSIAPVSPFVQFTDGCKIKHYYNGWSLYTAIAGIRMAESGVAGSARITEAPKALERLYESSGRRDTEENLGMAVECKPYACCKSVQYTLTALRRLRGQINVKQIVKIRVATYPYAWELSQGVKTLNQDSARLSIPYCAAAFLIGEEILPDTFLPEKLQNPEILGLMKRITVESEEWYDRGMGGKRGAFVEVSLTDGGILTGRADAPKWGMKDPPEWKALEEKFRKITRSEKNSEEADAIVEAVRHLEDYDDMAAFACLI